MSLALWLAGFGALAAACMWFLNYAMGLVAILIGACAWLIGYAQGLVDSGFFIDEDHETHDRGDV